ncbi:MAG: TatD family hydrolase [Bacteroidales bacterium]|nr:TatD family hydrolase [Bacteroidales bacterium]
MLIDTHTHFYDEWLLPDAEEAISRALSAGVSKMIQADVDSTERPAMWAIGQKHPGVIFQMLGLYPGSVDSNWQEELDQVQHIASAVRQTSGTLDQVQHQKADQVQHIASADRQALETLDQVQHQKADQVLHIASADRQALETLDQVQHQKADQAQHITSADRQTSGTLDQVQHPNQPQTANHPQTTTHPKTAKTDFINMPERFVAIGEIGLDYHEGKEFAKEQKEVLRLQFELAAKMNLPVNIHLRDAWEDFFAVLEDCRHLHLRGNLHCFTASYEIYERANKWADFSVGIGGVVTFKNSNLAKTLERIPMEKILLETDAPYLAPVPWRGKRNESAYLPIIAEKVAQIKGLSIDETADITTRNAEILFGI